MFTGIIVVLLFCCSFCCSATVSAVNFHKSSVSEVVPPNHLAEVSRASDAEKEEMKMMFENDTKGKEIVFLRDFDGYLYYVKDGKTFHENEHGFYYMSENDCYVFTDFTTCEDDSCTLCNRKADGDKAVDFLDSDLSLCQCCLFENDVYYYKNQHGKFYESRGLRFYENPKLGLFIHTQKSANYYESDLLLYEDDNGILMIYDAINEVSIPYLELDDDLSDGISNVKV